MTPAEEAAIELQRNARVSHATIADNDANDPSVIAELTLPLDAELNAVQAALLSAPRAQAWHVTVAANDPLRWVTFCRSLGVDPLVLELRNFQVQLMSTLAFDPRAPLLAGDQGPSFVDLCTQEGFRVVRLKHEVRALQPGETPFYHEAHAKLDGPWRPDRKGSSRDLLRLSPGRWYLTKRDVQPIDATAFAALTTTFCKGSVLAGVETEVVLEDTNIELDAGWL